MYSGATVLESHQIPPSIDYLSIVKHGGGHRLVTASMLTALRCAYSAPLGVPAAPA